MAEIVVFFLVGAVVGSFISALTWRIPRRIGFVFDRSKCDSCGTNIKWYDNIPLVSFILLKGRCRKCLDKISPRYPLIELACAVLFSLVGYFGIGGVWGEMDKIWALPYLLVVFSLLVAVFVIDLENQFIPDSVSLFLFSLNLVLFPVFLNGVYYEYLFAGFLAASILLFIHILTRGKGMGLGDSKLALSVGSFFSLKYSIAWLFLSFLLGAVVGIFLILLRKASLKEKLAFGPFLVISFFAMMLFGDHIFLLLFPGWK